MWNTELSLPMLLTFIRLIGSPIILPFFLVYLLPYNILWLNCSLSTLFVLFGLTDFFDGYLARRYHQVTTTGAMLDHIADKFLLYSTLIALVAAHKLYFFWAIIWIGREFFIMALRQIALENNFSITVSSYGKLKTVTQIACLAFVIINPYHAHFFSSLYWNGTELLLLLLGTALSVGSAYNYFMLFIKQHNNHL
jgi:CDP-diacylglycerol--glycerol-3-phosphate 3-phosphatidyltransferase